MGEDEIFFPIANARAFYVSDAANNILKFVVYCGICRGVVSLSSSLATRRGLSSVGRAVRREKAIMTYQVLTFDGHTFPVGGIYDVAQLALLGIVRVIHYSPS